VEVKGADVLADDLWHGHTQRCREVLLGHFVLSEFYGTLPMQIGVNLAGFAAMVGVAAMLSWYKSAGSASASAAARPSE